MKSLIIRLIDLYRFYISPVLGLHCRFHPSCSQYCREAVVYYGPFKGTLKGILRLLRCHPLSDDGGFDPIVK